MLHWILHNAIPNSRRAISSQLRISWLRAHAHSRCPCCVKRRRKEFPFPLPACSPSLCWLRDGQVYETREGGPCPGRTLFGPESRYRQGSLDMS
ncbi:UNVERIFIED_CONTAM: hypothetical protein K2H54_006911 [Gekko kuhli]